MKLPVVLFNGVVATTNGIYEIEDVDVETAIELIKEKGFVSAIGHEATALIMSEILGINIPMNRIQFKQEVGQDAIVLKLNVRPEEGKILTIDEMKLIGFGLKIMKRLK
ncbi:YddF family protein [Serpentinicella alkaliphila]|uniref:Uncharacterized protein DUF1874 n=1 Tax=Serpentinicella alkaliphila TaxID=1734049 RepID=A0A4R2U2V4_9FIRM|nr:YddF family protein [Serpentinicella alkaliphila]TCQ01983.1 uncharacterized protein DUF1874 [Serpentinicella alkaliphila]